MRWSDHPPDEDTWEPHSHLPPKAATEYELANNAYDYEWEHRCSICDQPCRSAHGVKIHKAKTHKAARQQVFKYTLADKAVQEGKLKAQQELRPQLLCEDKLLENVFLFKYLGTLFAADGSQDYDIRARVARAKSRCGKLRHIFDSPDLSMSIKLRLYVAAVCSLLTYGAETWNLNEAVLSKLRGANGTMLARITGRPISKETNQRTTSFDLTGSIRRRRFRWLHGFGDKLFHSVRMYV